jgi:ankyrin repeat protein
MGERSEHVERVREALRADPKWANFVWHNPDAIPGQFKWHNTILHLLADRMYGEAENLELAALVLEHGADPNARNDMGWTPLHYACQLDSRDEDMVALLLNHGADPNAADNRGLVPLDLIFGTRADGLAIRAMLLAHGAKERLEAERPLATRGRKRKSKQAEPGAAADGGGT